jgi:DinB family protein
MIAPFREKGERRVDPPMALGLELGMDHDAQLREHVRKLILWEDAHSGFDTAVEGIPPASRGVVPDGFPHSAWQLVEHLRLAQADILDFCRNPEYEEGTFPDDYWPASAAPAEGAWEESLAAFRKVREDTVSLVLDPAIDLFARIPHGSGQTYLREALLIADHNAYHVGQLIALRRLLGIWK